MNAVAEAKSDARERILETAGRLFYAEGIRAVGVDRLIAASDVAKATFYKHFPAKDDLVLAWLRRRDARWRGWFEAAVERLAAPPKGPRERLLAAFDALGEWFAEPGFRGCAFLNTMHEVADPAHPAFRASVEHKRLVEAFVLSLVREAGLPAPERLAPELAILMDGAIVTALMTGSPDAAAAARRAAEKLLGPPPG